MFDHFFPLLFPQGFRISKKLGHTTLGNGGKKTFKRYLKWKYWPRGPMLWKLDGVGPVDNRLSINKLHHFVKNKQTKNMTWHVTCGTWHVTLDKWHVTLDMRNVTCDMLWQVNILSKFQLPSYSGLWFMIFRRLGGKGWLTDWMNEWINDEADCRTAPAIVGLLIKPVQSIKSKKTNMFNVSHS